MFKFRMGQIVPVPTEVFASGKAALVGVELGNDNKHLRKFGAGYVYTLVAAAADGQRLTGREAMQADEDSRYVSEEQVAAWLRTQVTQPVR